ncbi:MAG: hypothetical protein COB41_00365 [Proteobacteria bacterium]|nr:MAG: hypothetical protein COB41_00365 [Pseudomonadota bacterium]
MTNETPRQLKKLLHFLEELSEEELSLVLDCLGPWTEGGGAVLEDLEKAKERIKYCIIGYSSPVDKDHPDVAEYCKTDDDMINICSDLLERGFVVEVVDLEMIYD